MLHAGVCWGSLISYFMPERSRSAWRVTFSPSPKGHGTRRLARLVAFSSTNYRVVKGGVQGEGGSLIFPSFPRLGILRVPQEHPIRGSPRNPCVGLAQAARSAAYLSKDACDRHIYDGHLGGFLHRDFGLKGNPGTQSGKNIITILRKDL